VLLLVVEDEELVRRLTGRRVCSNRQCNAVFHVEHRRPQQIDRCDCCGSALEQREDDRPETVRNRLIVYHAQTAEVVDYYRRQGLLREVDGTGSVEEVQRRLAEVLERIER
jgi:adenylate kinase